MNQTARNKLIHSLFSLQNGPGEVKVESAEQLLQYVPYLRLDEPGGFNSRTVLYTPPITYSTVSFGLIWDPDGKKLRFSQAERVDPKNSLMRRAQNWAEANWKPLLRAPEFKVVTIINFLEKGPDLHSPKTALIAYCPSSADIDELLRSGKPRKDAFEAWNASIFKKDVITPKTPEETLTCLEMCGATKFINISYACANCGQGLLSGQCFGCNKIIGVKREMLTNFRYPTVPSRVARIVFDAGWKPTRGQYVNG